MPQLIWARAYFRGKNKVYEMKNKYIKLNYIRFRNSKIWESMKDHFLKHSYRLTKKFGHLTFGVCKNNQILQSFMHLLTASFKNLKLDQY